MFCPQCGYQIDDDANFCQRCGARVRPIMGSPSAAQAQPGRPPAVGHPGELDREALRIHLSDVLALECIKSRLEDHQKKLAGRIDWRRNSNYLKKCLIREYRYSDGMCSRDYAYLFYNGTSCFLAMEQEYNNMRVCTSDWLPNGCQWVPVDDRSIRSVPRWSKLWSFSTKRECAQGLQKAYAEFRDAAPQAYRDNLQKIQGDTRALEGVAGELKKAGELAECCGRAIVLLVSAEAAMGEGEIAACQKFVKEAQGLLRTMCGDIFVEIREAFGVETGTNPYDIPSNFALTGQLGEAVGALGSLLAEEAEGENAAAAALYRKKTVAAVNTVEALYRELYAN